MIRKVSFLALALLLLWASAPVTAQFGGREGDVVIYALTSKGPMDFQVVPPTTTNDSATAAKFDVIDTFSLPATSIAPGFEARQRRILHNEPDDFFQFGIQLERIPTPRAKLQTTAKVFLLRGILRDDNEGSLTGQKLDFLAGAYAPFINGVVVGPDVAIDQVEFVFWTPNPGVVPFLAVPPNEPQSPEVPPGLTGPEYEGTFANAPFFSSWTPFRRLQPNRGWPDGIDVKLIEEDKSFGNTTQLIRLRPGKRTPLFRIPGSTHLFVIEGALDITPASSATRSLKLYDYAFIPKNFAIRLSNPKRYTGPGAR